MSNRDPITYQEAFRYLSESHGERYVQGATESRKRAIRKFTNERVTLNNGVLYYSESNSESEKINRQWIQNKELKEQILQSIHDNRMGGCHFGRDKTREKVCSRYFWHGICEDIDKYIKMCETCQKVEQLKLSKKYQEST